MNSLLLIMYQIVQDSNPVRPVVCPKSDQKFKKGVPARSQLPSPHHERRCCSFKTKARLTTECNLYGLVDCLQDAVRSTTEPCLTRGPIHDIGREI